MRVVDLLIMILFTIPFLIPCAAGNIGNELTEGNTEVGEVTDLTADIPEGWPDIIKYESYDIPDETDNPKDYIDVELGRWYAARSIRGLPSFEAEPMPGYIEAYMFFPKIPENRVYVYVLPKSDTGIDSIEEMCARVNEAYEGIEDYVWFEEKEPGFGKWGYHCPEGQTDVEFREKVYEILYGVEWDITNTGDLYPVFWSTSPAHRGYYENDFGHGYPGFISKYPIAEAAAKNILGTEGVTFDMICLIPPVTVFKGDGHTIYLWMNTQNYYIDERFDKVPDRRNPGEFITREEQREIASKLPGFSQNPDGTPKNFEENSAKWKEVEEEYLERRGD